MFIRVNDSYNMDMGTDEKLSKECLFSDGLHRERDRSTGGRVPVFHKYTTQLNDD